MATILPLGKTQFCDAVGNPVAGGSVYFYIPNTTTPKDTWQDAAEAILNSNPVILDSAGEAVIYGSGAYRQVVKDANGNLIWDQQTSETSSGQQSFGGTSTGTANAQVVSAGTFDGTDGSVITFTAGVSNTGAMTLQVGSASPVAVYKNSGSGPVNLASGDIVAGNIYSVVYSVNLAAFQLLQSIPPSITIASQADAEAGTNNTNLMTPLRSRQGVQAASLTDALVGRIQSPVNQTYMLALKVPFGFTITETTTICESGTCTARFAINTTALGGAANAVSTTEQSQPQASANVGSAGNNIQMTISSNSSCVGMSFRVEYTRTLS